MKVIKNMDSMSNCINCVTRWAEVIIFIEGIEITLCSVCRKELMKEIIDKF